MIIYAGILLAAIVATYKNPAAAAGVLTCTWCLEQWSQAKSSFFFTHGTFTNYATGMVGVFGLIVAFTRRRPTFRPMPVSGWVTASLYLWAFVAILWSPLPKTGWANYIDSGKYSLLFGGLLPLLIYDRNDLKVFLISMLSFGFAMGVLLLTTVKWGYREIIFDTATSFSIDGLARGNPLAVGTLGGQLAIAAFLMNFRGAARFWQLVRYAVVGVGFALAVKSGSRGQAIALVAATLIFLPYARRFKDLSSFIGFAVSLALFSGVVMVIFDLLTVGSVGEDRWKVDSLVDAYTGGRIATSGILLASWVEAGPVAWILGLGTSASYKLLDVYPHVVPVEALGEMGMIGFALVMFLYYHAARVLVRLWSLVKDSAEDRGLIAAYGAMWCFEAFLSLKQGSLLASGGMFGMTIVLERLFHAYRTEVALYEQLDAGGYAMSADEREHEFDDLGDPDDYDDHAVHPDLEPAHA